MANSGHRDAAESRSMAQLTQAGQSGSADSIKPVINSVADVSWQR